MRSRTTKSSRSSRRTPSKARRSTAEKLRRYLPIAAVICASAYLPPQVLGTAYKWFNNSSTGDVDGNWNTSSNWSPSGVPLLVTDTAEFGNNFTANRTVTLNVDSLVSTISLNDPKPQTNLTIIGSGSFAFKADATTGLTLNPAFNNILTIAPPSGATTPMIVNSGAVNGKLIKTGLGTVVMSADNTYTGPTSINAGILQVAKLADGGVASPLGQSAKDASNLLFNGGTLKYTGAAVSINRSFTVGDDLLDANGDLTRPAGTIDSSGSGVITFNDAIQGVIKGSSNAQVQSTLVLRGTSGTAGSGGSGNQIDARLADGDAGAPLSLLKTDTGAWRLTNGDNSYTGDTIVQRGILSLDYRTGGTASRIPNSSRLVIGGLPGGGTVDLITSGVYEDTIGGFVVKPGANLMQGTSGNGGAGAQNNGGQYFFISNLNLLKQDPDANNFDKTQLFYRTPGAGLRMNNTALIQTDSGVPDNVKNFGGWLTINDDWVTVQQNNSGKFNTIGFSTLFTGSNGYKTANGGTNTPPTWLPTDNIDITGHLDLPLDGTGGGFSADPVPIWSLRFSTNPTPSKALVLADYGDTPTILDIQGGGLMQTSNSGNSHILQGILTSAEGELFVNVRANNLLLESAIEDHPDLNNGQLSAVGLTKWGTGTLILQPKKDIFATRGIYAGTYVPNWPTNFSGNVYVNEGTLVVRQPDGLGRGVADPNLTFNANPTIGKTVVNGGTLDFQGVQSVVREPAGTPNPQFQEQERVEVYSGTLASTQGRSGFAGSIKSMNRDAVMSLNIGGFFEVGLTGVNPQNMSQIVGSISGISGFSKIGSGTLVVNGSTDITPDTSSSLGQVVPGVGDVSLTAGNSIFNGTLNIGAGTLNATGGNTSINGTLTAARISVTGSSATSTFLALNTPNGTFGADVSLTNGTTLLSSPVQAVSTNQTYSGNFLIAGGTVVVNNSVTFSGPFTYSSGSFSEVGNVIPGASTIPTVKFTNTTAGAVNFGTGSAVTVTLQGNTVFNAGVTPTIGAGSTLTLTGLGVTTFNSGINVNGTGTFNLVNAVLNGSFTVNNGTQSFNGLNTINAAGGNPALTINAGTFQQAGTRRGIVGGTVVGGIYGVRDKFNGGLFPIVTNPIAIAINNTTAGTNLAPNINGANEIIGNIQVSGVGSGFTGFTQTTEVFLSNNQTMVGAVSGSNNTGNLRLMGGRATVRSAQALGDGVAAGANQYTVNQGGGVTITGEKSVLLLERGTAVTGTVTSVGGVATAQNNEDIVIGPTTGYVTGVVVTARGSNYSSPTVTFGAPPAGGTTALGTAALSGSGIGSINFGGSGNTLGAGYTSAPSVTFAGGSGSGAAGVAILGGPVVRTNDQHNVWGGNLILDNISTTTSTGTVGSVTAAIPVLSVNSDDSLEILGKIFGNSATANSGSTSRLLASAIPGGPYNSSSGFIILSGMVQDTQSGFTTTTKDQLRTDWGGNNELQVWVNNQWNAAGLVTVSQGMMRFTKDITGSPNFFASGFTPNFELSAANANNTSVGWNATNVPVGLYLTKPGQVFNAPSFTVRNGNTDKLTLTGGVLGGGSTGFTTIGGENTSGTVTFGTGTGNINIDTDSTAQLRDLRLYANNGGTVDIKNTLFSSGTGAASITKLGDGTVRLLGSSSASTANLSRAYFQAGTLELAGFDTFNNARLSAGSGTAGVQTFFGGGNLRLQANVLGGSANNVTQQLNGTLNVLKGGSTISVVENWNGASTAPAGTLLLASGAGVGIRRDAGGTLRFTEGKANGSAATSGSGGTPASSTTANILIGTTTAFDSAGVSQGTINKNVPIGFATFGTSPDQTSPNAALYFAQILTANGVDGYNVGSYSTTGSDAIGSWASNAHVSESNGGSGFTGTIGANFNIGSIRFGATNAAAGSGKITIDPAATLTVTEGILLASNAGGANREINGGKLTAGTTIANIGTYAKDLVIHNYGGDGLTTGPSLTINSQVTGTKALTLTGDGTTILTNTFNDFIGNVYVNGGVLSVNANSQLGNAANQVFLEGGTIKFTDDYTLSRIITASGDRSTVAIAPGKTLTLNNTGFNFRSDSNLIGTLTGAQASTTYGGTNLFAGDLALSGGGTIRQVVDNGSNPFFGQIIVTGNTKYISETNNSNFFGNAGTYSNLDGTTVDAGSTIEIRSTNTSAYNFNEFFTIAGAGQNGEGAIHLARALVGPTTQTDREIGLVGPVTLSGNATITVDDAAESVSTTTTAGAITATTPGFVGLVNMNDNIVDGGGFALTKNGAGVLRFINDRIQNLPTMNVTGGELKFESGVTGVLGAGAGFNTPLSQLANYFTGTSTVNVGGLTAGAALSTPFASNPRLWFNDWRGVHTANINLNGGFMIVTSPDSPNQSVNFGGTMTVSGGGPVNGVSTSVFWDAANSRLVNNAPNGWEIETTGSRANPTVLFGPLSGDGALVKFGRNELQIVNANTQFVAGNPTQSAFSGDLVLSRGGFSSSSTTGGVLVGSPSLGLYDGGALPQIHAIYLTNDASIHLDNLNGLDTNAANDNKANRLNDAVQLHFSGDTRLRLIGNTTGTTTETVGNIYAHSGASAIELDPGVFSANNYRGIGMSMGAYSRDQGGVIQFRVLGKGISFVAPAGIADNKAYLTMTNVPSQFLSGGSTVGAGDKAVIVGAFGGAATNAFSSLPGNTTVPLGLNNNEQLYVAREFMTWDSGTGVVRPLADTEKFKPTVANNPITAQTIYFFPSNTPANQNLELRGGFGPFSSAVTESLTAEEGLFVLPGSDASRKQDSTHVLQQDLAINSLRFAAQSTEFVSGAGNRLMLELKDGVTLTLNSGMILNGSFGTLQDNDSNTGDVTDQRMFIRGGTIDAGNREIIIHNTAASFRENSGTWANSNADLNIHSTLKGSAGLTKSGLGLVNLGGQNDYTGTTTVTEGILRLNNDKALGRSQLLIINGLGDVRYGRGVTIGSPSAPVTVRFTNPAAQNNLLVEGQYNTWYGDVQIDNLTSAGERPYSANLQNNASGAMVMNGNIYGLDSANGGTSALNDIQRGRGPKQLILTQVGGIITLNGSVRDLPGGPLPTRVDSSNEDQLLRTFIQGNNNESQYYLNAPWDAVGALALRRGNVQLEPAAGALFFTNNAALRLNPYFANSRTTLTDTDTGSSGDASFTLTTAGQVFNTPQMNVGNSVTDATKTLIAINPTGHTQWFTTGTGQDAQFDALQHTSNWDSIVRLYSTQQGTSDIFGRITATAGQNSGLYKIGSGTVSMKGMPLGVPGYVAATSALNDFSKAIIAGGGTLELDYDTNNLGAVTNAWGTAATNLVLAGGRIQLKGDTENVTNQTWTGLTARGGGSEIVIGSGSGALGLNLTIGGNFVQFPVGATGSTTLPNGALNHTGSTINFVNLNPTGTNTAKLTLTATGNQTPAQGVGGAITPLPAAGAQPVVMGSWGTYGNAVGQATDWAARNNAGVVTAFSNYNVNSDPASWLTGPGLHIAEGPTGFTSSTAANLGFKTIKFGAPNVASTLNLPSNFKLGNATNVNDMTVADDGGILVPSGTTALKTIAGGTIQTPTITTSPAVTNDLYIHNYGTGGLNIQSTITGPENVVFTGSGKTTLTSDRNLYTGTTYISNGTLEVDSIAGNTSGNTPTNIVMSVVLKPHLDQFGNPVFNLFDPSNAVTVSSSTGFFVGQRLSGTNTTQGGNGSGPLFPAGAVVTAISGNTIEFSQNANGPTQTGNAAIQGTGSVGNQLGNSVGSSTTGLVFNGGTLRYTQTTVGQETFNAFSPQPVTASLNVPTARPITLGGTGGTIEITDPGVTLQLDGVITSVQNAALQAGTTTTTLNTRNNYVGDLIKTGPGGLTLNAANTYTGKTDVQGGTLTILTSSASALGTSYNDLDGTIIRNGAALRLSPTAGVTIPEWITMEGNSTLDVKYANATQQTINLDGVLTLGSRVDPGYPAPARDIVNITYSGDLVKSGIGASATYVANGNAGNAVLNLNAAGGYLRGSAIIQKGTIWGAVQNTSTGNTPIAFSSSAFGTSAGGILVFNESSPEFTGTLHIDGGKVVLKSLGVPLGTGVLPVMVGTLGSNYYDTSAIASTTNLAGTGTQANENVFPEANLFFQPENAVSVNGGASSTGSFDTVPGQYRILQDIIINKPHALLDAQNNVIKPAGNQIKQIGVTTTSLFGTGLGNNMPSSQDSFNFDGRIIVDDDFNLYLDDNATLNPAAGTHVNINLNNKLVTGVPNINPNGPLSPGFTGDVNQPAYLGNITTRILQNGRAAGAEMGIYNDLFLNVNVNGDNREFGGAWTIGNTQVYHNGATSAASGDVLISNPDLNHVLTVGNNLAFNGSNQIKMLDEATFRVNGHTTTIGSLVTDTGAEMEPVNFNPVDAPGYTPNPVNSVGLPLTRENFTTADIPRNIHFYDDTSFQNFPMIRAIVENGSNVAGNLTINQTVNSFWNVFIRDGVTAAGGPGAALSITKTGNAIAEINEENIYTGGTTVNGGYLQVTNAEGTSATGTGQVTINHGGGISGDGYIAGHVSVSGSIRPGRIDLVTGTNFGGLLTFDGGTHLHTGTTLDFQLLGDGSEPLGAGFGRDTLFSPSITIDGQVSLQLMIDPQLFSPNPTNPVNDPNLQFGSHYTLLTTGLTGPAITLAPGYGFDFYGNPVVLGGDVVYDFGDGSQQIFRLINDNNGRDLTLVAVPEPGTATTLLSGAAMLLGLQRFRRRSRGSAA